MILDIDRLHKFPKVHRGSGRTTDMLCEALQCADFSVGTVIIVAQSLRHAGIMMKELISLARALEMSVGAIGFYGHRAIIENTLFKFISVMMDPSCIRGYQDPRFFIDHQAASYSRIENCRQLFQAIELVAMQHAVPEAVIR